MSNQILDTYDFEMREINKVPVYYKNFPTSPCIHIRIIFKTGAFDDPVGKEGLSHYLEHMIFAGSYSIPDKKAVRDWSKKYALGTWNAATALPYTYYHLSCLPDNYKNALSGMKDLIFSPFLRVEDFEQERKVITQEAWGRYKNEKLLNYSKGYIKNAFPDHAHGRISSPLGWPDTIEKITHDDIIAWQKQQYGIGNFYIVITGAIDDKDIDVLADFTKDLPISTNEEPDYGSIGKPGLNRIQKTADEIGKVQEQVEIEVSRVLPQKNIKERFHYHLFNAVLQDILHERYRVEQALCYGVSAASYFAKTYGVTYMEVKTDEKNISIIEEGLNQALSEIRGGKHVERFEKIKAMSIEQILSREELAASVANNAFPQIYSYGKITTTKDNLFNTRATQYEDIVRISEEAYDPKYIVTEIILPSKKEEKVEDIEEEVI